MARGGHRPGAGRPVGAKSRLDLEAAEAVIESGLTPLQYLTSVYRDVAVDESKRIEAAKAAAPYVHPKLSQIEANITGELTYEERLKRLAEGD